MEEIKNHTGTIGWLSELKQAEPNSVFVFQMPRYSQHVSSNFLEEIRNNLRKLYPTLDILIIPGDVNIFEILPEDALALKLKGIL